MSVRQIAKVLSLSRRVKLSQGQRNLLTALANAADDHGDRVFPGTKRLLAETGLSRRWLQIALHRLVDAGWVEVTVQGGRGRGRRTWYRLHLGAQQQRLPLPVRAISRTPKSEPLRAISVTPLGDLCDTFPPDRPQLSDSPATGSGTTSVSDPSMIRTSDLRSQKGAPAARTPSGAPAALVSTWSLLVAVAQEALAAGRVDSLPDLMTLLNDYCEREGIETCDRGGSRPGSSYFVTHRVAESEWFKHTQLLRTKRAALDEIRAVRLTRPRRRELEDTDAGLTIRSDRPDGRELSVARAPVAATRTSQRTG